MRKQLRNQYRVCEATILIQKRLLRNKKHSNKSGEMIKSLVEIGREAQESKEGSGVAMPTMYRRVHDL